jgi:hypothetical protein
MPDGCVRDSVIFSIVVAEWPGVREWLANLQRQPRALRHARAEQL